MKGVKLLIKQKFIARKELVVHMTTDLSRFPLTEGASTSGQTQSTVYPGSMFTKLMW